MLGVGEAGAQALLVGAGGGGQIVRRLVLVPEDMRAGIEILDRQVARQQFAIAVDQIGAGDDGVIGEAATAAAAHQGHIDQAKSHQRESGDAEDRSDDDAPLEDAGASLMRSRIPNGRKSAAAASVGCTAPALRALALRTGELFSGASPRRGRLIEGGQAAPTPCRSCPVALRQFLDAGGTGDTLPFGLQHADVPRVVARSGD